MQYSLFKDEVIILFLLISLLIYQGPKPLFECDWLIHLLGAYLLALICVTYSFSHNFNDLDAQKVIF